MIWALITRATDILAFIGLVTLLAAAVVLPIKVRRALSRRRDRRARS